MEKSMKKSEELIALCPKPKHTSITGVSITAVPADAAGKYIQGKVLTVALWDEKSEPFAVWYFNGEYWLGTRRDGKTDKKSLKIKNICWDNDWHRISASLADAELIRSYFPESRSVYVEDVIADGQNTKTERLKLSRDEQKEKKLQYWMAKEPPESKDFEDRIRRANSDLMFLWVDSKEFIRTLPDGKAKKIKFQQCRCDVCGRTFSNRGLAYKHKQPVKCPKCHSDVTVHLERYGARSKYTYRKFIFGQQTDDGYWLREYGVGFDYRNKRCELHVDKQEVYLLGPNIHYGFNWAWSYSTRYPVLRSAFAPEQIFYGSMYSAQVSVDDDLITSLDAFMNVDFNIPYMDIRNKNYSLTSKLIMWRRTRNIPMAESLVKTGWGESLFKVFEQQNGEVQRLLNLKSKSYYGVFCLNRAELKAVGTKDLFYVADAKKWKALGLTLDDKTMNQIRDIVKDDTLRTLCAKYGTKQTLKYLRQVSRRSGAKNDKIDRRIASDWEDYVRMSKKLGIDLSIKANLYPLQLSKRHNEVVSTLREREIADSIERRKNAAEALDKRFGIKKVMKRIRPLYEFADEKFCIVVPESVYDIERDSLFLGHCVANTNRYYERISAEESYIVFLRHSEKSDAPWYTLEIEPGGTIRQKRSYQNEQYADLQDAMPFLKKWQSEVQRRMDDRERKLAVQSKQMRNKEFDELTVNGNVIRTGRAAGKLLVDELMKDLMEAGASA